MDIDKVFNEVTERMRADFNRAGSALSHAGMKGSSAEETLRTFLREYLPRSLDVSSGILVDAEGRTSRQLDVIIFDAAKTPVLHRSGEDRVVPVECAYAVIEVKSKLNAKELDSAFKNMLSVRALNKTAYYVRGGPILSGVTVYEHEWEIWPTNFFVFAFDSTNPMSLMKKLDKMHLERTLPEWSRIDCICVLDKGVILNYSPDKDTYSALPEPGSRLFYSETKRSLLLFYSLLSHFANQMEMPNFRFLDYISEITF